MKQFVKYFLALVLFYSSSLLAFPTPFLMTGQPNQWTLSQHDWSAIEEIKTLIIRPTDILAVTYWDNKRFSLDQSSDDGKTWDYLAVINNLSLGIGINKKGIILGENLIYPSIQFSKDGKNPWLYSFLNCNYPTPCREVKKAYGLAADDETFLALASIVTLNEKYELITTPGVYASQNGIDWDLKESHFPAELQNENTMLREFKWYKNLWIALGTNDKKIPIIVVSSDKINWKVVRVPESIKSLKKLIVKDSVWLLIATQLTGDKEKDVILLSPNQGQDWRIVNTFPVPLIEINGVAYGDQQWMLAGTAETTTQQHVATLLSSPEGLKWQLVPLSPRLAIPSPEAKLSDVAWDGKKWIVVGRYDPSLFGCMGMNSIKSWQGTLSGSHTLSMRSLRVWMNSKIDANTYEAFGDIEYFDGAQGPFVFGVFDGICKETEEGAVSFRLNFENLNYQGTLTSLANPKLNITDSAIEDASGGRGRYTGVLLPGK